MSVGALLAPGKQDLLDMPPAHDKRGQATLFVILPFALFQTRQNLYVRST